MRLSLTPNHAAAALAAGIAVMLAYRLSDATYGARFGLAALLLAGMCAGYLMVPEGRARFAAFLASVASERRFAAVDAKARADARVKKLRGAA